MLDLTAAPKSDADPATDHQPPPSRTTGHSLALAGETIDFTVTAGWTVLREKDKPVAEMFAVAYTVDGADPATRPVTFVFNGGPGAVSAYLHVGALGPKRVVFDESGRATPPPARFVDDAESWLPFTDLVFIDAIRTGFSRPSRQVRTARRPSRSRRPARPR